MASVLYCAPDDVREALSGTDAGTGTAAQLSDDQITAAIQSASDEVSAYSGTLWDSSSPQAVPPQIVIDLTISIAQWYATLNYLKGKALAATDPVQLRYNRAVSILKDVRDGVVNLVAMPPGQSSGAAVVINRIPKIFTHADSNTVIDVDGFLQADSAPGDFSHVFGRPE